MDSTLKLVAVRGYHATTVAAIEEQAGLAPGSSALYQHFKGKYDVLVAAVERELLVADQLGSLVELLPIGNLRAEFTLIARWSLTALERRSDLARLVRREALRLPTDLVERLFDRLEAQPCDQLADWLQKHFDQARVEAPDLQAVALVLLEALSSYGFMLETFGRTPDSIDHDRFTAAWVDLAVSYTGYHGLPTEPSDAGAITSSTRLKRSA